MKHPEVLKSERNYSVKGILIFFVSTFIFSVSFLPVFCQDGVVSQQSQIALRIKNSKNKIQNIKALTTEITPISHELHDYFQESVGIIERLLNYVQLDAAKGESVDVNVGINEAQFLSSYLKEELNVAATNDKVDCQEIDVTNHGLKGDGVTNNKEPLEKLLSSLKENRGRVKLLFPPGKYFIRGKSGESTLSLVGLENIVFKGLGNATLIFDGHVVSSHNILVRDCRNLEFRNLSVDIEPLICTLGEITSVESGNKIIIKICEGYPLPDSSYWTAKILRGLVRDSQTGKMMRELGDPRVIKLEELGARKYRLTLDDNALSGNPNMTTGFSAGQLFSLHPRARPGSGSTLSIFGSEHLTFSHFNIYAGDAHLVFISRSAGVKFLDCDIMPKEGRVIMNNADGFHCQSNKKGIYLERCRVMEMNDDCMNFYTKLSSVGDIDDDRRFTLLMTANSEFTSAPAFSIGDNIAFLNANTGEFDAVTSVKAVNIVNWGGQTNLIQIETKDALPGIISRRSAGRPDIMASREYTPSGGDNYRKAMSLDAPFEHMVMNFSLKNDGFIVRNSEFGYNRATGFKCKATNGVMRNTIFHDQVLLFQAGLSWLEGIYPSKLEVTDVTVNKGIRYQATLPGKNLSKEKVAKFMKYINFKNVVDGSGKRIPAPDELKVQ